MTIEDVENRLKSKLKRIENCETQFHVGQKQQIVDVLAMLSLLDQSTVILPLPTQCCWGGNNNNFAGVCSVCGGLNKGNGL